MLRFKNSILLQSVVYYILVVILLFAIPSLFLSEETASDDMESLGLLEAVILYLFGAAVETLISCTLIIDLLRRITFFKENRIILIIVSAIPFALGHFYNLTYVITTFLVGFIFIMYYLNILEKTKSVLKATGYTLLLHFIINVTVHVINKNIEYINTYI